MVVYSNAYFVVFLVLLGTPFYSSQVLPSEALPDQLGGKPEKLIVVYPNYVFTPGENVTSHFVTPSWALKNSTKNDDESWKCDRPWPELELFLPVALLPNDPKNPQNKHHRLEEYKLFLRSLLLFWPLEISKTSLRVLFDEEVIPKEKVNYDEIVKDIKTHDGRFPGGLMISTSPEEKKYISRRPHDRQQNIMLWADNFTTSEYVGYVDSDSIFLTYIDREDIFEDGKPVINGRSGPMETEWWAKSPLFNHDFTGLEQPMRCMSYFPVVIKTAHLKDLRDHIVKHWNNNIPEYKGRNLTFDDIFYLNSEPGIYQFDLMCTYLFNFKQNEYKWYAHPMEPINWNGIHPKKDKHEMDYSHYRNKPGLPDIFQPKPRIATHARYRGHHLRDILLHPAEMNRAMQLGICISPPLASYNDQPSLFYTYVRSNNPICKSLIAQGFRRGDFDDSIARLGYYNEMWHFEGYDYQKMNTRESLQKEYAKRVNRIKNCQHHVPKGEVDILRLPGAR